MKLTLDLEPLKTGTATITPGKVYYEQVLVRSADYPTALMHIDTFYTKEGNPVYDALNTGQRITVTAELEIVK